jgi:hypothetical protein
MYLSKDVLGSSIHKRGKLETTQIPNVGEIAQQIMAHYHSGILYSYYK